MANVKNSDDILIGTGRVYIDGEDVGQIDGDIEFTHSKDYYEKKSGFPAVTVKKVKTEESYTAEFDLLEANLATIMRLMPEYSAITETAGTGSVTGADPEIVEIYSMKHTSLAHSNVSDVTITDSEDVALVEGTDYYLDRMSGTIYRVPTSSALADGDSVKVVYTYATYTGSGFGIGGASTDDTTYQMEFWHKRTDGKYRCVKIYKAQIDGDFAMAFKEDSDSPISVTLTAVADSTKPAGQQFGTVMDYEASAAPDGGW